MTDALILGGGLAGGAAALLLARQGKAVRVIERERQAHHNICGEFLSVEAHDHLRALGIDPLDLGAVPIDRVRLVSGRTKVEGRLPFTALGLGRNVLDEALLDRAQAAGAEVERGVRVRELSGEAVRTSAGDREGGHILLATGKLPIREDGAPARQSDPDAYVGFKMHYRISPVAQARLTGVIQLVLFDGGYAGLQLVDHARANLCLVIRQRRLAALGGQWADIAAMLHALPYVGDLLADAEPLFDKPLAIANLAYGPSSAQNANDPVYRLGDQAGMTASLTGDGMAMALRSAFIAAQCLSDGRDAAFYRAWHRADTGRQLRRAMALQRAVGHPLARHVGVGIVRLWPALLGHLAGATRLPEWRAP